MKVFLGVFCMLLLATGCTTVTILKTEPIVTATTRPINIKSKKILVVTPTSFQQVSGGLTQEATSETSNSTKTRGGVFTSLDYNALGTAIESELINKDWHPISQSVIAKVAFGTAYQKLMESFKAQGSYNLVQTALIVGKELKSNYILIIKNAKIYSDVEIISQSSTDPLFFAESAILNSETAEVIWSCKISIRPTDLITSPLTTGSFIKFDIVENEYGSFNCNSSNQCVFTLINKNRFSDKAIELAANLIASSLPTK